VICITNLTPVVRPAFRIGVPDAGRYREVFNSDDLQYGGSGIVNPVVDSDAVGAHDRPWSITLQLPPLASIFLQRDTG
jgi:1,4-alpha-glucan branching enzyme